MIEESRTKTGHHTDHMGNAVGSPANRVHQHRLDAEADEVAAMLDRFRTDEGKSQLIAFWQPLRRSQPCSIASALMKGAPCPGGG